MSEKQHPEGNGVIKVPSKWLWALVAVALGYSPARDTITGFLPERGAKAAIDTSTRSQERDHQILQKLDELDGKLGAVDSRLNRLDQRVDRLFDKTK